MTLNEHPSVLMIAGEASGDLHGAGVIAEILKRDPRVRVYGVGGQRCARAGMRVLVPASDLAATGLFEAAAKFRKIWRAFRLTIQSIERLRPSVAVLIDYPDFNLRLAKKLRKRGIPVVYYITPQVWAWRTYRVRFMKKWISKLLVVFPFESQFYGALGMKSVFVGHPLLDQLRPPSEEERASFQTDCAKRRIALMPGSRTNELRYHLKPMLQAAKNIRDRYPDVEFILPAASTVKIAPMQSAVEASGVPVTIVEGQTYEALSASDLVICGSGTATLEAAILGKPMVVILKLHWLTYAVGSLLFSGGVPFFALPNLLASRKIVPELIQSEARPYRIAEEVLRYLNNADYMKKTSEALRNVKKQLGSEGACRKVAEELFGYLDKPPKIALTRRRWGWPAVLHLLLSPLLWIASLIYGGIIRGRRFLYWTRWFKAESIPVKVVSVGNMTVGGTGKTPLTIYLAKTFQKTQKQVAILSRGYKRKAFSAWDCVSDGRSIGVTVQQSGDEPMLMAQKLKNVPVYVGAKRAAVAKKILERHPVDVLLLDDGFQHWQLVRDFDFLTVDVTTFGKRAPLLPLGRFREPLTHIKRSNCIVLTRTDHIDEEECQAIQRRLRRIHPNVPMIEANYRPSHLRQILTGKTAPLTALSGKRVVVFSGIGNPRSFKEVLRRLNSDIVDFRVYADHFRYGQRHIQKLLRAAKTLKADYILTTEKDAVRIPKSDGLTETTPLYALVVDLEITRGQNILSEIIDAI